MTAEQIICEKRAWAEPSISHQHSFGHLLFPLQGELALQMADTAAVLSDSQLVFVPPGSVHTFHAQQGRVECLAVDIPSPIVAHTPQLAESGSRLLRLDADWRALRTLFLSESNRRQPSVNNLLYYSFGLLRKEDESPSLAYLHAHYFEPISVCHLARLEHYSVGHYSLWFKRKTGRTPAQYIQQLRLDEAKRLLRETSYPLEYIARAVGYSHQSYLTRLFVQIEGLTPLRYRNGQCKKA